MSGHNPYSNQTWNSHPPNTHDISTTSHLLTTQQYGANPPYQPAPPRSTDTTAHGQIHPPQFSLTSPTHPEASHTTGNLNTTSHNPIRGHQSSVVSSPLNVLRPPENLPHSTLLEHRTPTSEPQQWIPGGDNGGQPSIFNTITPQGRRPTNGPPDASPQKCRIPECTYNAFFDVSEQEQTEYCGQRHELQAISTGLVASCVVCRGRPRRTGERVCGRTCGERERQAHQIQGSYYGVPVIRREPRTRPGP